MNDTSFVKAEPKSIMVMIRIDIQRVSHEEETPTDAQLELWARKAVQDPGNGCELTIRIVDTDEGADLNRQWRNKSGPTNVLSFPFDGDRHLADGLLGDIIICAPVVRSEAMEQQKSLEAHWAHMVIHGVLHLQGFDHTQEKNAEIMESVEINLLQSLGFDNPYLEQQNS